MSNIHLLGWKERLMLGLNACCLVDAKKTLEGWLSTSAHPHISAIDWVQTHNFVVVVAH